MNNQSEFSAKKEKKVKNFQDAMKTIVEDVCEYYPKAVLLFGSLARWLAGQKAERPPNDMDILIVGNRFPFKAARKDYGVTIQLNRLSVEQTVAIAKSLRYDARLASLSKLYSKNVVKRHSIDVITACLLLGPGYQEFGIEQIEVDGVIDKRDYSIHQVLSGHDWWTRLCQYARQRRGPWKRFSDRIVQIDKFEG